MSSTFTPGPWHVGGVTLPGTPDAHVSIWAKAPAGYASGDQVAQYVHPRDASLIAAAPDLLAALQRVFSESLADNEGAPGNIALLDAKVAIAKATGGQA